MRTSPQALESHREVCGGETSAVHFTTPWWKGDVDRGDSPGRESRGGSGTVSLLLSEAPALPPPARAGEPAGEGTEEPAEEKNSLGPSGELLREAVLCCFP